MKDYHLYLHAQRKKQTKQIMNKIDIKHYFQQRKRHSQGIEIGFEYSQQLKYTVKRSKTQKVSLLEKKDIRQRMMTEVKADLRQRERNKIEGDQFRSIVKDLSNQYHHQNQIELLKANADQHQYQKQLVENPSLLSENSSEISSQIEEISFRDYQIHDSTISKKRKFLPMLQLYIQQQQTLKEMNAQQLRIRNLIVTMIILAINRKRNSKPLDALQILLQSQIYFPKQNKQMVHLKSIWLQLIGKIYLQTKQQLREQKKGRNRWRNYSNKPSSTKLRARAKRQKTIFVKSLASRKIFLSKFSQNLRKSRLVFETTYMAELINEENQIIYENNNYVNIFKKMDSSELYLPDPKILFRDCQREQDLLNYSLIIVSKDEQTNLFPLNFPQSLRGFMRKQEYINKIVEINSEILPSTRCFTYNTSLFLHYQIIISIFLSILIMAAFLLHLQESFPIYLVFVSSFVIILLFAFRLQLNTANTNSAKQMNKMMKICLQWQREYKYLNMIVDLTNDYSILNISFPIDQDFPSQQVSESISKEKQASNEMRKCSIKMGNLQMGLQDDLQEINNDINDEDTENKSFCYGDQNFQSGEQQVYNLSEISEDQIQNKQTRNVNKEVQVQFITASNHFQLDFQ